MTLSCGLRSVSPAHLGGAQQPHRFRQGARRGGAAASKDELVRSHTQVRNDQFSGQDKRNAPAGAFPPNWCMPTGTTWDLARLAWCWEQARSTGCAEATGYFFPIPASAARPECATIRGSDLYTYNFNSSTYAGCRTTRCLSVTVIAGMNSRNVVNVNAANHRPRFDESLFISTPICPPAARIGGT